MIGESANTYLAVLPHVVGWDGNVSFILEASPFSHSHSIFN
jgi:hypothetical protein